MTPDPWRTISQQPDAGRERPQQRSTSLPCATWTAERWAEWEHAITEAHTPEQSGTAPETASREEAAKE